MISILFRTIIIYTLISAALRFMGKRQIGELEVGELVTALLLSEVASIPIDDPDTPLLFAIIPVAIIATGEVLLSFAKNRFPSLKRLLDGKPSILIRKGKLRQKELGELRISAEELLGELRLQSVTSLTDVDYAILESNGKLSVILKKRATPPTCEDVGYEVKEEGLMHAVIVDGRISEDALFQCGRNRAWLEKHLKEKKMNKEEIFLLTVNDGGRTHLIPKEKTK